MKKICHALLLCLCLASSLFGQAAAQTKVDAEAEELLATERRRSDAIAKHDTAYLDKLYAEDFRGVTATGYEVDKARLMRVFTLDDPRVKFAIDELQARVFGKTAVVTGRLMGRTADGGLVSQSRYMHVYVKRSGRWQIVAGQGTAVRTSDAN